MELRWVLLVQDLLFFLLNFSGRDSMQVRIVAFNASHVFVKFIPLGGAIWSDFGSFWDLSPTPLAGSGWGGGSDFLFF